MFVISPFWGCLSPILLVKTCRNFSIAGKKRDGLRYNDCDDVHVEQRTVIRRIDTTEFVGFIAQWVEDVVCSRLENQTDRIGLF